MSAERSRGKSPFASATPASFDRPVIVPMASKKLVKTRVKTSISTARKPMRSKLAEAHGTWPRRLRSGTATAPGIRGTDRPQPPGFCATARPTVTDGLGDDGEDRGSHDADEQGAP